MADMCATVPHMKRVGKSEGAPLNLSEGTYGHAHDIDAMLARAEMRRQVLSEGGGLAVASEVRREPVGETLACQPPSESIDWTYRLFNIIGVWALIVTLAAFWYLVVRVVEWVV